MIKSKPVTPEYADGWDRIFGKKNLSDKKVAKKIRDNIKDEWKKEQQNKMTYGDFWR